MFPSAVAGLEEGENHVHSCGTWTPSQRRQAYPLIVGSLGVSRAICWRSSPLPVAC